MRGRHGPEGHPEIEADIAAVARELFDRNQRNVDFALMKLSGI